MPRSSSATATAASAPLVADEPRPYSRPSRSTACRGDPVYPAFAGTVSMCAFTSRRGGSVPKRAYTIACAPTSTTRSCEAPSAPSSRARASTMGRSRPEGFWESEEPSSARRLVTDMAGNLHHLFADDDEEEQG